MSNFVVTGGLGGNLVVTGGYGSGFGAIPAGQSVLKFSTGDLLVNIEMDGGKAYLIFKDGTNDIKEELPFTTAQLNGIEWAIIKVIRDGTDLLIYHDKALVTTVSSIVKKTYGGNMTVMELNENNVFDPRALAKKVSKEAMDYYMDDLDENSGNALLPDR